MINEGLHGAGSLYAEYDFFGDVSGPPLNHKLAKNARQLEMQFFRDRGVYRKASRAEANSLCCKAITTRWIDSNKGDEANPNYRSRLVGKEYNTGHDNALYASTPPLEALRIIVSSAATGNEARRKKKCIMINDVSRAYFYAHHTRDVYIEVPAEDPRSGEDVLGKLRLCLYGTRDAASNWQETLSNHLVEIGFKRGIGHPSVFWHKEKRIKCMVRGDDYVSEGFEEELLWMENWNEYTR